MKGIDMSEIIFFKPIIKELIWGEEYWGISAHENGDCQILNGTHQGKTLSTLWKEEHHLFGDSKGDQFPLLIKVIDAREDLSIQVHPDDAYADREENGSLGKTECWYILDCIANGTIVMGHNARTKDELVEMIEENRWDELIRTTSIEAGDFFQIAPGTVHAIKGGTKILEVQQNSDITYRLYDYGRMQNGKPRELHIQKSIDVIKVPYEEELKSGKATQTIAGITTLEECKYYTVQKIVVEEKLHLHQDNEFQLMYVLSGKGSINDIAIKEGDFFLLEKEFGSYLIEGNVELMRAFVL